jgi:hypothetical protein
MSNILHLYAQAFQHQEAWVVGTKESLIALRDTINQVLESGEPKAVSAYTNDGEGYRVLVWGVSDDTVKDLRTPYVDPMGSQSGKGPFQIIDLETYRALVRG